MILYCYILQTLKMLDKLFAVVLWAFVVQGQNDIIRPQVKAPTSKAQTWPHGIVYYEVDNDLKNNDLAMEGIKKGMKMWSDKTCIRFEKRTNEDAYIYFYLGGDCYSEIGRAGYKQFISLAPHCWQAGEAAHFIGLALGLYPEQSRYDRDNYVTINWDNIRDDAKPRFIKYPKGVADIEGFDYDYQSIMHFKGDEFTKNGLPTVVPEGTTNVGIGQRNGPSVMDVEKIYFLYHCDNPGGGGGASTTPPTATQPPTTSQPTTPRPTTPRPTTPRPTTPRPTTPRPTTTQPTTPRPTTPEVCADRWSRLRCMHLRGSGWCYKNPEVMKYHCKKTCNKCGSGGSGGGGGGGGGNCKDELMYCSTWVKHGWCKSQQSLMERTCRRSCNFCSGGGTGTGGAGGGVNCKDQLMYCDTWVKHGWCSSMRNYMESYCRKSCNFCGNGGTGRFVQR